MVAVVYKRIAGKLGRIKSVPLRFHKTFSDICRDIRLPGILYHNIARRKIYGPCG